MAQTKAQTREGAAAIYTVVFFCLLIGIVTIGFVSIMIQDIIGSTNYDLSQSAYDAALAGVEDAKVLLLQYNTCMSSESRLSDNKCQEVISAVNTAGSSDDCDLVRDSLGRAKGGNGANETLIQSVNDNNLINNKSKDLADNIDMAYTCVKLSLASEDYLGTLTETSDVKIIPLRTGVGSAYNDAGDGNFNRIRIRWYSQEDNDTVRDTAYYSDNYETSLVPNIKYGSSKTKMGDITGDWHTFDNKATLPPAIRVGLIQTPTKFIYGDLDSKNYYNGTYQANTGSLFLRPIKSDTPGYQVTRIASNANSGFYGSLVSHQNNYTDDVNATNSPVDIKCLTSEDMLADDAPQYACTAEIDVPSVWTSLDPRNTTANNGTRFLTLSSLYAKPDTSFSVQLLNCSGDDCRIVKFVGVQSKVDATGRANNLFRRVEARVELQDVSYPFIKYGLNVYGSGSGDGEIFKNYWATSNCWYKDKGVSMTCNDYQRASDFGNF